ncbi:hypothetical protein [Verrucomicrobium sp. BvORR034]|uniref:hypothetical protein n=1 Tax=Verrucomicrobium sp. BvORR034 TaxID=1396418 RepID=UPI002240F980|nr:hypothetical protein [Verrucomicrobium sp. BvORR034]
MSPSTPRSLAMVIAMVLVILSGTFGVEVERQRRYDEEKIQRELLALFDPATAISYGTPVPGLVVKPSRAGTRFSLVQDDLHTWSRTAIRVLRHPLSSLDYR